jgi:uncharacterized protein YndB with AHSA1/START domain
VTGNVGERTGEASVTIAAPPERVWAMVTDVTRMGEWSPENVGGEWLDGATGPAAGVRFKGHNRRGKAKWSTTCEITEAEPGRSFVFVTGGTAKPDTWWRYRFEPVEGGAATVVTESFELRKPVAGFSKWLTKVTTGVTDRHADMVGNIHTSLGALKAAAEAAV